MSRQMNIEGLALQEPMKRRLQTLAASSKLAHLWIFISPVADMAAAIGRAFLLDWLTTPSGGCRSTDPDFVELKTSGKAGLHSIASIRYMLEVLSLAPHGSKGRAVLVDAADRMLPSTANALLKALEEPPPSTVIVLATASPHLMLPTILSRAQTIRFPGHRQIDTDALAPMVEQLQQSARPSYSSLMKACEAIEKEREKEQALLSKQLSGKKNDETADLSPSAKQELAAEAEAGVALWSQHRAKQILEDLYLFLRDRSLREGPSPANGGERRCEYRIADPAKLTDALLQALNGIDRGADLSTMLLWFVTHVSS